VLEPLDVAKNGRVALVSDRLEDLADGRLDPRRVGFATLGETKERVPVLCRSVIEA
jgi:hypothetical protein